MEALDQRLIAFCSAELLFFQLIVHLRHEGTDQNHWRSFLKRFLKFMKGSLNSRKFFYPNACAKSSSVESATAFPSNLCNVSLMLTGLSPGCLSNAIS